MSQGFSVTGIATSPITGGDGNKEFLIFMIKDGKGYRYERFDDDLNEVCL
jgi:hypothetical protein